MKFSCSKKSLSDAVDIVSKIISNKPTLPVLGCVLFDVQKDIIVLQGTNIEFSIEVSISTEIKKQGKVAIPAQTLIRTIKTIRSDGDITLELQNDTINITTKDGTATIKTIPHEDFPKIPKPNTKTSYKIKPQTIVQGIQTVIHSASTSVIKPELSAVYMYHEDDKLVFVATDQFRLSEKSIDHKTNNEIPPTIIPVTNASKLLQVLDGITEEVIVYIDDGQISIQTETMYLTSRIIDGSFPDYKAILPKETTTEMIMLKADFVSCLQKMQIFSDKFGKTSLHIYPSKNTFTASSHNSDLGEVFDSPQTTLKGEDLDIAFNYRYLLDAAAPIIADSISLSFAGIGKPLVISGVGDNSFMYLVMPMNK